MCASARSTLGKKRRDDPQPIHITHLTDVGIWRIQGLQTQSQVCDWVSGHLQFSQKTQISSLLVGKQWRAMGHFAEQKPSRISQALCKRVVLGKTFWDLGKSWLFCSPKAACFCQGHLWSHVDWGTQQACHILQFAKEPWQFWYAPPLPMAILQRKMGNEELGKLKRNKRATKSWLSPDNTPTQFLLASSTEPRGPLTHTLLLLICTPNTEDPSVLSAQRLLPFQLSGSPIFFLHIWLEFTSLHFSF